MEIFNMTPDSIPHIAKLMSTIKAEWWNYEEALGQLSNIEESITYNAL